jgi:hypothetical protein
VTRGWSRRGWSQRRADCCVQKSLPRAVAERQRREEMLTPLTLTSGVSHRCKRRAPPLRYGNVTAGTTGLRLDEVQTQPAESRTWVAQTAVTRTIGWPGLLARVDLISNLTTAGTVLSCSKLQVSMFATVRSPPCPSRQLHPWWSRGIAHSPRPPRPRASMSLRLSEPRGRRAPEIPSGWAAELPDLDELRMGVVVSERRRTLKGIRSPSI